MGSIRRYRITGDILEIKIKNDGKAVYRERCSISNKKMMIHIFKTLKHKFGIDFLEIKDIVGADKKSWWD